jgi:hypothetical protein
MVALFTSGLRDFFRSRPASGGAGATDHGTADHGTEGVA